MHEESCREQDEERKESYLRVEVSVLLKERVCKRGIVREIGRVCKRVGRCEG